MATSPIYSWPEPDNTDLVKNGALAIRTLGNAIDTTMATMTPKSLVDAKGDLIAASANDTPARLAVGANGETLVADSSTSTGLRYQAPVAVNPIINGGSDIWQRGTSAAMNSGAYTYSGADRWMYYQGGGAGTISRQASGLEGIQYCQRWARNSGSTSTLALVGFSNVESANCYPFAGKTVTYSFYARAGANFSSSNGLQYFLFTGTGTDQNVGFGGFTNQATAISGNATLTTSWQRFQFTATLGSTVTQFAPWFQYTPTGTAGAADYFEVTGLQLEVGSIATPFRRSGGTIQGELAACQRYYYRFNANGASNFPVFGWGWANTTGNVNVTCQFPVTMRTKPSAVDTSAISNFALEFDNSNITSLTSITIDNNYTNSDNGQLAVVRAGVFTVGKIYRLTVSTSVAATIGWSAEL